MRFVTIEFYKISLEYCLNTNIFVHILTHCKTSNAMWRKLFLVACGILSSYLVKSLSNFGLGLVSTIYSDGLSDSNMIK